MIPPSSPPSLGALLIGGGSRRMGADKARLSLGDVELGLLQARRLETALRDVVLIARSAGHYGDYGFRVWADLRPGLGPVAGIERALEGAGGRRVVFLGCDLPFLRVSLLRELALWDGRAQGCVPRLPNGDVPLCGVLRPEVLPGVRAFLDEGHRRFQDLIASIDVEYLEGEDLASYGDPARLFFNVNTMGAYQEALERMGGELPGGAEPLGDPRTHPTKADEDEP